MSAFAIQPPPAWTKPTPPKFEVLRLTPDDPVPPAPDRRVLYLDYTARQIVLMRGTRTIRQPMRKPPGEATLTFYRYRGYLIISCGEPQ